MKRDLEALSRESKEPVRESPSKFRFSSRRSSVAGPLRVYDAICICVRHDRRTRRHQKQRNDLSNVPNFMVMIMLGNGAVQERSKNSCW